MRKNQIDNSKFTKVLFNIYIVLLIWTLLFKLEFNISPGWHNINLIPFTQSAVANGEINYSEIILNIAAFIPFGLFISILKPNSNFIRKLYPIIITTISIELLQFILKIGATDITDIINNILGGIIGILLYKFLFRFWEYKINKTLNIILFICMILFSALIIIVKAANI